MGKYTVVIEETAAEEFELEAKDSDEALKIVEEKYSKGEFVLCPGELQHKQMFVLESYNEHKKETSGLFRPS